ncbi:alpha 1,3-mannosyltransferase [Candida albicans P87]|nr:alpha 1,3-mannosyltransferase [Candida albicans P87]
MIEKLTIKRSRQKVIAYSVIIIWLMIVNIWLLNNYHLNSSTLTRHGNGDNLIDEDDDSSSSSEYSIYNELDTENYLGQQHQEEDVPNSQSTDNSLIKPTSPGKNSFKDDITIKILQKHLQKQQNNPKDIRTKDSHAEIYNQIFENHPQIDTILGNLNFNQRCQLFFQNLFIKDNNWILNVKDKKIKLENKNEFKFNDFKKSHLNEFKRQFKTMKKLLEPNKIIHNKDFDNSIEFQDFIKMKYEQFWNRTMTYEQKIVDSISILRIFNKCYLIEEATSTTTTKNNKQDFIKDQFKLVDGIRRASKKNPSLPKFKPTKQEQMVNFDNENLSPSILEHRVYPWLSFEYPVYERWTGKVQYQPPKMANYVKDGNQKTTKKIKYNNDKHLSSFFLNRLKQKCNGRGLVLSISDLHVDVTVRLIHLLRALNNRYPIQIVYYDNLSKETKEKIVTAAREVMSHVPKSFERVAKYFPDDYLDNDQGGLPKQEIWFINTYNVIHADYKLQFRGFANKFLATLFNSFDEFILLDADTVLTQSPSYFFNLPQYLETGTFFYKDRTTYETRPKSDSIFFEKLGPSVIDSVMFNIPIMTSYTLNRSFFKGLFHYMESGLVVLNRDMHYSSFLTMVQMNFFEPVNSRIHGDKEIFWLAMAINGKQNYYFDENYAAAVGVMTPDIERTKPDKTLHESKELCSPHPGHISHDDNSLVWLNSGFFYCGQNDKVKFVEEFKHKSRLKHLNTLEAFKTFYYSPLRIENAIIPPMDLDIWAANNEDEPAKGWFGDPRYCSGYMWCAYDKIGGKTKSGKNTRLEGKIINFDEQAQDLFNYYGDVWVGME